MLKVFNPLLQLVTTQMYGYEILCSNGAWRGREIIINPTVGCFSILQLAESRYHNSSNTGIWTREVISSR